MNSSRVELSRADPADELVLEAVRWIYRFTLQQLALLFPALVLGTYLGWLSGSPDRSR